MAGTVLRRPDWALAPSDCSLQRGLQSEDQRGSHGCFPDQYIAFDKVLGAILKHLDDNAYVFIVSDHGIKPLSEFEENDRDAHLDHEKTTPVIAKHDFADGDDVPWSFFAMGPGIKHGLRLMGFNASVYDIAPTILNLYGIPQPAQMRGRVLSESFESSDRAAARE